MGTMSLAALSCGASAPVESSEATTESVTEDPTAGDNPMYIWDGFDPLLDIPSRVDFDRYASRMEKFAAEEQAEGQIVFYGSSTFTRWTEEYAGIALEDAILTDNGEKIAVNRGFGGSNIHDLCYHYRKLIPPLKPKAVVITTFMNATGYSETEQLQLAAWLIQQIRKDCPGAHIYITDCRPMLKYQAPDRKASFIDLRERLIRYAENYDDVTVIPLSNEPMFYEFPEAAGTYQYIDRSIYVTDQVHLNEAGYEMLTEVFKRYIADELK